jgi:hypothetical protein
MSDRDTIVPFNPSAALIEETKKERQRLLEQIEQSHKTIERSLEIIARIDRVLAAAESHRRNRISLSQSMAKSPHAIRQ